MIATADEFPVVAFLPREFTLTYTRNQSKYHSWYLCQISLQIMLLPKQIFQIVVIIF